MIRTLLREVRQYKAASIATPLFMILEVLMEMVIPFLMASIIDDGVNAGDIRNIFTGWEAVMIAAAAHGAGWPACCGGVLRGQGFRRICEKPEQSECLTTSRRSPSPTLTSSVRPGW